ncbi:UNVERIFIED_CONTAM: zgc [Trichonephila clavipes]
MDGLHDVDVFNKKILVIFFSPRFHTLFWVSCTQSYFVSELSWCPEEDLERTRGVELQVCTLGSPLEGSGAEGDNQVTPSTEITKEDLAAKALGDIPEEMKKKMETCPFVLDIDLDFYSTRNPFYALFNEKQFDILRKLYHYEHPKDLTEEVS